MSTIPAGGGMPHLDAAAQHAALFARRPPNLRDLQAPQLRQLCSLLSAEAVCAVLTPAALAGLIAIVSHDRLGYAATWIGAVAQFLFTMCILCSCICWIWMAWTVERSESVPRDRPGSLTIALVGAWMTGAAIVLSYLTFLVAGLIGVVPGDLALLGGFPGWLSVMSGMALVVAMPVGLMLKWFGGVSFLGWIGRSAADLPVYRWSRRLRTLAWVWLAVSLPAMPVIAVLSMDAYQAAGTSGIVMDWVGVALPMFLSLWLLGLVGLYVWLLNRCRRVVLNLAPAGVASGAQGPCLACGFVLEDASSATPCPACGFVVPGAAGQELLSHSDARGIARMIRGVRALRAAMTMSILASVVWMLDATMNSIVGEHWSTSPGLVPVLHWSRAATIVVIAYGFWRIAVPQRCRSRGTPIERAWKAALGWIGAILVLEAVVQVGSLVWASDDGVALALLLGGFVAWPLALNFQMKYLRLLAARLPDRWVFDRAELLSWLVPVLFVTSIFSMGLGMLIAFGLYLQLLSRIGRGLRRIRTERAGDEAATG